MSFERILRVAVRASNILTERGEDRFLRAEARRASETEWTALAEAARPEVLRFVRPWLVISTGVLLLVCGFTYDVLFAGIPPQDPPPAVLQDYAEHAQTASRLETAGAVTIAFGIVLSIALWLLRRARRSANES